MRTQFMQISECLFLCVENEKIVVASIFSHSKFSTVHKTHRKIRTEINLQYMNAWIFICPTFCHLVKFNSILFPKQALVCTCL